MSDETEEQKILMRQIDISCVQAFHTVEEIDAMVELAKKYRLAAVFTLPAFSAHVAERLQDTREIHAGGVVSVPGGGDTTGQKKRQAKELWEAGCREIDMVMNLTAFRSHEFSYVKEELLAIREQVTSAIFKVFIEAPQLTEQEICQADGIPAALPPWSRFESRAVKPPVAFRSRPPVESAVWKLYRKCRKPAVAVSVWECGRYRI